MQEIILKSDYIRIEMKLLMMNTGSYLKLKSDYIRIEIKDWFLVKLKIIRLKSDYIRIEIKKGGSFDKFHAAIKIRLY